MSDPIPPGHDGAWSDGGTESPGIVERDRLPRDGVSWPRQDLEPEEPEDPDESELEELLDPLDPLPPLDDPVEDDDELLSEPDELPDPPEPDDEELLPPSVEDFFA